MRGHDRPQATMLTLVNPEQRVAANHPIRLIKALAEVALKELSPLFEQMYSEVGRPSIPPERLLKASLLMALYTVRSERMFCEQLDYNLLFRWFLDMNWDEPGFDHSTFSRNRARLLEHDVAGEFFRTVVAEARELGKGAAPMVLEGPSQRRPTRLLRPPEAGIKFVESADCKKPMSPHTAATFSLKSRINGRIGCGQTLKGRENPRGEVAQSWVERLGWSRYQRR